MKRVFLKILAFTMGIMYYPEGNASEKDVALLGCPGAPGTPLSASPNPLALCDLKEKTLKTHPKEPRILFSSSLLTSDKLHQMGIWAWGIQGVLFGGFLLTESTSRQLCQWGAGLCGIAKYFLWMGAHYQEKNQKEGGAAQLFRQGLLPLGGDLVMIAWGSSSLGGQKREKNLEMCLKNTQEDLNNFKERVKKQSSQIKYMEKKKRKMDEKLLEFQTECAEKFLKKGEKEKKKKEKYEQRKKEQESCFSEVSHKVVSLEVENKLLSEEIKRKEDQIKDLESRISKLKSQKEMNEIEKEIERRSEGALPVGEHVIEKDDDDSDGLDDEIARLYAEEEIKTEREGIEQEEEEPRNE